MDSITQIVLGATVQGIGLGRYQGRKALAYGAILGTLPDLDVFIHYGDPVSQMTFHRGFSHSLLVLPVVALVMAWLIKKHWPQTQYSFLRLYLTLCFALITHPLLDAFTVYGTQLFWPFTPTPQQWSGVFIIDLLYTVPMLCALIYTLIKGLNQTAKRALTATFVWSCLYLGWGTYGAYYHARRVENMLTQQGIVVKHIMATPMPANTLLYHVMAQTDHDQYIEAVSGWFDTTPPEYIFEPQGLQWAKYLQNDALYQRLFWFCNGWLRIDNIDHQLVVTDLREGAPGLHAFRFVMAKQLPSGQWQTITPTKYEGLLNRKDFNMIRNRLGSMWQRIWHSQPPLPLRQWAAPENQHNTP